MAGWSDIPQSAGDADWASVSGPWAELYAAWNERRAVLGQSAATATTEGVVIADKDWIEDIQAWVESYCSSFVKASDYSGTSEAEYDGASTIIMWDWDTFKAEILGGGWKRKGGPGAATGRQEAGYWASYIELMNQLKDALNALVWTLAGMSTTYQIDGNATHSYYYLDKIKYQGIPSIVSYISWDAAKGIAEAAWVANAEPLNNSPSAYSYGFRSAPPSTNFWTAALIRQGSSFYANALPSGIARQMDSYVWTKSDGIWDDNGDAVIQDKWSLWETGTTNSDTTAPTSGYISPDYSTIPNWCPEPGQGSSISQGWVMMNAAAILRWNVSGGFQYV